MIDIDPKTVDGFRKMFKREYGVDYSDQEAWEATNNLLGLFNLLLQMDRKQHPENYKKQKKIMVEIIIKERLLFIKRLVAISQKVYNMTKNDYAIKK